MVTDPLGSDRRRRRQQHESLLFQGDDPARINRALEGGASIESRNTRQHNATPLIHHAKKGHRNVVRSILENHNPNISAKDTHGDTGFQLGFDKESL